MLKHANCFLSVVHANQLWTTLISHAIFPEDLDTIFQWYVCVCVCVCVCVYFYAELLLCHDVRMLESFGGSAD